MHWLNSCREKSTIWGFTFVLEVQILLRLGRSVGSDFATPWPVIHQAPLSMGFPRQEHWSGLPFPPPGHLSDPGIEPRPPTLQADSLPAEPPGKPMNAQGLHWNREQTWWDPKVQIQHGSEEAFFLLASSFRLGRLKLSLAGTLSWFSALWHMILTLQSPRRS